LTELQALYRTEADEGTVPSEWRYAGFWMRFWAFIFDMVLVSSLTTVLLIPFNLEIQQMTIIWNITFVGILGLFITYVYFLLMTKITGQTLGKMILGIKVVRADGKPLEWKDLIFREVVGRSIYNSFPIMQLIYLGIGFTSEKQGLHDYFADTRVIFDE